jgi:hypothetical protein
MGLDNLAPMSLPTLKVTIVDAAGGQQTYQPHRLNLDCGCLDIRPGRPAYCRGFEHGMMTLDEGGRITTLKVAHGMASLAGDAIHVLCEQVVSTPQTTRSSLTAISFPGQPPVTTTNEHETHYHI